MTSDRFRQDREHVLSQNPQLTGTVLRLHNVGLHFGPLARPHPDSWVLSNIELTVQAGQALALIGANGSGKSTLLRLMHGLLPPCSGTLWRNPALRQAMLFQRPHMLRASALHNVALGLWLGGLPWAQAKVQAQTALQRVGLGELAGHNAYTLSGGQQQRLALGRAWALRAELLLLDEPTASLDPHAKREVERLMAEFAAEQAGRNGRLTLIFASHNLGQVKRLAERVVYLEQGRILADLPVAEFFDARRLREVSPAADLFVKGELV